MKAWFWYRFMKLAFLAGRACDKLCAWFNDKGNEMHAWGVYGNGRLWELGKAPAQIAAAERQAARALERS